MTKEITYRELVREIEVQVQDLMRHGGGVLCCMSSSYDGEHCKTTRHAFRDADVAIKEGAQNLASNHVALVLSELQVAIEAAVASFTGNELASEKVSTDICTALAPLISEYIPGTVVAVKEDASPKEGEATFVTDTEGRVH